MVGLENKSKVSNSNKTSLHLKGGTHLGKYRLRRCLGIVGGACEVWEARDSVEGIAEKMQICPWCGSGKNRFDTCSQFSHICHRCHKGILPEWRFCPWCYGVGFESKKTSSPKVRYHCRCKYCDGKLIRFMRYCPWCHRKVRQAWDVRPFPEVCGRCHWPVDTDFWNYCPWCKQNLMV